MKTTSIKETKEIIDFTREAAEHFRKNISDKTYASLPGIEPGCLLAIWWNAETIIIVKLDKKFTPLMVEDAFRDVPFFQEDGDVVF